MTAWQPLFYDILFCANTVALKVKQLLYPLPMI